MRRKVFDFVALLSLLLCIGTVVLAMVVAHIESTDQNGWIVRAGILQYRIGPMPLNGDVQLRTIDVGRKWFFFTIRSEEVGTKTATAFKIQKFRRIVPDLQAIQFTTMIVPAIWLAIFIERVSTNRRMLQPTRCRKCRYDLTGNTSGICPECGTAVARKAEA